MPCDAQVEVVSPSVGFRSAKGRASAERSRQHTFPTLGDAMIARRLPVPYNPIVSSDGILTGDRGRRRWHLDSCRRSIMHRGLLGIGLVLSAFSSLGAAQEKKRLEPTAANVAYGKHERQVLDFWQAKSEKPTPL